MKAKIIILSTLLLVINSCDFVHAQNKRRRNRPQQQHNAVEITPTIEYENIIADNEPLLLQEYNCKANFKTTNENGYYPTYCTREVSIEWPSDWRGHNLQHLQKALLTWMGKLWTGNNTNPFISVDDILKTYCVKGSKSFPYQKDLSNCLVSTISKDYYPQIYEHRFECRYISGDICIYEHVYHSDSHCPEGNVNYFYYDIKNSKALTVNDLIESKSDAVQTIVNEYIKIINYNDNDNNSRYANVYYNKKIESLRKNGFKDLFINKDNITFVYDFNDNGYIHEEYAIVSTSDAMPALTSRAREIIDNMPVKEHQLLNGRSSRIIAGILTLYKAKENLNDYTRKGDLITDSNYPTGRVVDYSPIRYKFEDDNSGAYECYYLPKTKVIVEEYGYNELLLSDIEERITFVSNNGKSKITILKYDSNVHSFKDIKDNSRSQKMKVTAKPKRVNDDRISPPKYVLCYELKDQGVYFVPLKVEEDHVVLYTNNDRYNAGGVLDASQIRYKSHAGIHFLDYGAYGFYTISSFFDSTGRMTSDIPHTEDIPEEISIAYFHDSQKLYVNGEFYTLYEKIESPRGE
ncbi:MAG: hypothetical protein IKX31_09110 [Muribaculaceae bacterium]|nr:hypothetical protein [Muribaculaceae bacterium]